MVDATLHVLLVEDDQRLAELTQRYLRGHHVECTVLADGVAGEAAALRDGYDCVLLDLMLPGRDGIEVCRNLRSRIDVPIIMLTARREEADRVLGLEIGADDYMTKPFSPRELLARIRAQVRRARGESGPARTVIRRGRISLDQRSREVTVDGVAIELTSYEYALLHALCERPGRVLTREQLLELARGSAELAFDRSIDVHVSRLRAKLGDDARRPRLLKTVRGAGYVLAVEES